jgi:hypothetical protein
MSTRRVTIRHPPHTATRPGGHGRMTLSANGVADVLSTVGGQVG